MLFWHGEWLWAAGGWRAVVAWRAAQAWTTIQLSKYYVRKQNALYFVKSCIPDICILQDISLQHSLFPTTPLNPFVKGSMAS